MVAQFFYFLCDTRMILNSGFEQGFFSVDLVVGFLNSCQFFSYFLPVLVEYLFHCSTPQVDKGCKISPCNTHATAQDMDRQPSFPHRRVRWLHHPHGPPQPHTAFHSFTLHTGCSPPPISSPGCCIICVQSCKYTYQRPGEVWWLGGPGQVRGGGRQRGAGQGTQVGSEECGKGGGAGEGGVRLRRGV